MMLSRKLYERYLRWRMSPAAYLLWTWLEDPSGWEPLSHTLRHKETSVNLWASNGVSHVDLYDAGDEYKNVFTGFERRQLWKRIQPIWKPVPPTRKARAAKLFTHLMHEKMNVPKR